MNAAVFAEVAGPSGRSQWLSVFAVEPERTFDIVGRQRTIGGAFQPSALLDSRGTLHVFFQARLDSSDDNTEKLIAHVTSTDGGRSFSDVSFVNTHPLQTYAISCVERTLQSGARRISLLTCLSIDEMVSRYGNRADILDRVGIATAEFSRKAASLVLEYYSDDYGATWMRKEHPNILDREYSRNGRDLYAAFFNTIGQIRRIDAGPWRGRLILAGHLTGDYLPCPDHPHFRDYRDSSGMIYSDDEGESWQFGGHFSDEAVFDGNEASAVPVDSGNRVLMIRRCESRSRSGKIMHYSNDGGASWGPGIEAYIPSTRCLQVLDACGELVLCSTPGREDRTDGRIYISADAGRSWRSKQIEEGLFSYSTIARLSDDHYICCFSLGGHGHRGIGARVFTGEWLRSNRDSESHAFPQ